MPESTELAPEAPPDRTQSWRTTAGLVLLAPVLFVLMLTLFQRALLFPASPDVYRDPSTYGWAFEDVRLPVGAHETHAWYVPLEGARGTVIFSHGNAGNIADRLESMGLLRELGFSVLAYDYGGYGHSTGSPSEMRLYDDIRAAWRWLTLERGVPASEVVLFGRSLGGGPTVQLATEVQPAAVVLESTFTSVTDMARGLFPFLPVGWLVYDEFANVEKVADIAAPLLFVHSPDDTLIPYTHGRALYDAATEPKTFLEIRGDHNSGFVESMEVYVAGWEGFLAEILPRP